MALRNDAERFSGRNKKRRRARPGAGETATCPFPTSTAKGPDHRSFLRSACTAGDASPAIVPCEEPVQEGAGESGQEGEDGEDDMRVDADDAADDAMELRMHEAVRARRV